jgi:photosystem II stability/assembly factor-like uncharacterized protein
MLSSGRINSRRRRFVLVSVVLAAAVAGAIVGVAKVAFSSSGGTPIPATSVASARIRDAQLVTPSFGWALTPAGLYRTRDSGGSWTAITPSGLASAAIRAVFFRDPTHGWLAAASRAASGDLATVAVYRTTDGGTSWASAPVTAPSPALTDSTGAPASFDFLDAQRGWLSVTLASSSAFSTGLLFATGDGGRTWTQQTAPIGAPVTFVDSQTGWTAGGAAGNRLFVTRDGGKAWAPESLPLPAGQDRQQIAYGTPVAASGALVSVPVTLDGPSAKLDWFVTRDRGKSWNLAASVDGAGSLEPGTAVPTATAPTGDDVSVLHDGTVDVVSGQSHSRHGSRGLPLVANSGVADLSFASAVAGWAVVAGAYCTGAKTGCHDYSALFRTRDGGSSWEQIQP